MLEEPGHSAASWLVARGSSRAVDDRTAVLQLDGLLPETTYRYRLRVDDGEPIYGGHFTTWPAVGGPGRFSVAFGGGAGFHPPQERIWRVIASHRPTALLLLGDNIYSDDPETPAVQEYCYYRRQSRPEFRDLAGMTPVLSIWDDHDFGTDDAWGGPDRDRPTWKLDVWRRFTQNWANPAYGGGELQPGVWYDFSIGDVDFFMLDGRYWRTNSGRRGDSPAEEPDMIGPAQAAWLCERLAASSATFKVVVSPVPWDFRAKPGVGGLDTWAGFPQQRERIFRFLSDRGIDGVLLMSADRHRSDAWRIDRAGDYPLFEFNSSRLTNDHVHATMDEAIFSYNATQSFGWVTFDTRRDDPQVRYQVISIEDEPVAELTVSLSQLRSPLTRLQMPHQERFEVSGRSAFVWLPEESLRQQPQPWIFYAPTLPAYPDEAERWMHEQFLAAGIAVAGVDVGEAYGSPAASEVFDALYQRLTQQRGFARRAVLFGRSRGGLWASSWGLRRPEWAAGLIGIYPVYDFLTYPGLEQAAAAYGLTPQQMQQRVLELNPVERLAELAVADIPVRLIHGDVDTVVPLEPNSGRLLEAYRQQGKESLVEVIVLKDQGHSFYRGFFESQPLVDFAIERARQAAAEQD
jgi:alkaline phosphatase D